MYRLIAQGRNLYEAMAVTPFHSLGAFLFGATQLICVRTTNWLAAEAAQSVRLKLTDFVV